MEKITQLAYWNTNTYGQSVMINKNIIKAIIVSLGVIVPVVLPVPVMIFIASKVKNNYRWCYK